MVDDCIANGITGKDEVNTYTDFVLHSRKAEREVFLRNMNLVELDNDVVRPTGLGLLLFGKKPQSVYPNAVIKTTLKRNGKAVETKTIEGRIPAQLDEANKWYKEHIPSYR